jgi:hypothetical protein
MSFPNKVDGFGTRLNESDGTFNTVSTTTLRNVAKFVASEAISIGHVVALDFAATEPDFGYGGHVKQADSDDALNQVPVGIALEAASASGDVIEVQIWGRCDVAQVTSALSDSDEGKILGISATSGELALVDVDGAGDGTGFLMPVAVLIEYGTAATADSQVFLLNPCKYPF